MDGFNAAWLKTVYQTHVARSRAIGKDGIRHDAFEKMLDAECELIAAKVNDGTYRPTNYREKLIARGSTRPPRQISVPTIRDRLALRGALEFLKTHFPISQPRPPHIFIKDIKVHLKVAREHSSFLRMDIKDFYPSLRHDLLQAAIENSDIPSSIIRLIIKSVSTRTGTADQPAPMIGVPQGLSISNALAAIYMTEFDKIADDSVFYRRYVDDILVIAESEKVNSVYKSLWTGLENIGLASHAMGTPGKTETSVLGDGVQYLGYEITPNQISVRQSSLAKMFSNLAKVLTCFRYKRDHEKHLFRLNLKISGCIINNSRRGWLMFFSQTDNISQLAYLDSWLKAEIKNLPLQESAVKTFKKSYYEIRFNLQESQYIPNFDQYNVEQKKQVIVILSKRRREEVDAMDVTLIEREFDRLIGREVSELEKDLIDAFS
ncbi:MAG TPA: reverse transcriptase domain-containing protein [Sphingobium sp.]